MGNNRLSIDHDDITKIEWHNIISCGVKALSKKLKVFVKYVKEPGKLEYYNVKFETPRYNECYNFKIYNEYVFHVYKKEDLESVNDSIHKEAKVDNDLVYLMKNKNNGIILDYDICKIIEKEMTITNYNKKTHNVDFISAPTIENLLVAFKDDIKPFEKEHKEIITNIKADQKAEWNQKIKTSMCSHN